MKVTPEIEDLIDVSVNKAVKKAVKKVVEDIYKVGAEINKKDAKDKDYFKMTESLLYHYSTLKEQIESPEDYVSTVDKERAKSIVFWSSGGSGGEIDRTERVQERIESLERTREDVLWIENALAKVRHRKEYPVLELRYFNRKEDGELYTLEEIAEKIGVDERTVRRRRSRIIKDLSIHLFGTNAIGI